MKSDFENMKAFLENIGARKFFTMNVPMGWIENERPTPKFINFGVDAFVFPQEGRLVGKFCSETCGYDGDSITI